MISKEDVILKFIFASFKWHGFEGVNIHQFVLFVNITLFNVKESNVLNLPHLTSFHQLCKRKLCVCVCVLYYLGIVNM